MRKPRLAALFGAAAATVAILAAASAPAAEPQPSLIESKRAQVTLADYEAEMAKLPVEARAQFSADLGRLIQMLNNLFLNRAITADARAEGVDRDPALALQIQHQTERLLAQAYIEKLDQKNGAAFDSEPDKYNARAREIYITQQERFQMPARVRVSRLLVRVRPGAGDDAARARAEALHQKLVAGEDFAALARTASDDPLAKENGGEMGFVAERNLDPAFAAAAFALKKPGELSPVVKTDAGYEIIKFQDRREPGLLPYDEVRPDIIAEIRQKYVEESRAAYQRTKFADPPVSLNEPLIDKINRQARATAKPIGESRAANR
jgi:peptidyl-prolyl cis-trans isomerase C